MDTQQSNGAPIHGQELFGGSSAGPVLILEPDVPVHDHGIHPDNVQRDQEIEAFEAALSASETEVRHYIEDPSSIYRDVTEPVFQPQLLMLEDESFSGAMRARIEQGESAIHAIQDVASEFEEQFEAIGVQRIREKADDVRDLKIRLLSHLPGRIAQSYSARGRIAIVYRPLPSTLIRLALDGVAGLVLVGENLTAHVTILAGSLGIPALLVPADDIPDVADGDLAQIEDSVVRVGISGPTVEVRRGTSAATGRLRPSEHSLAASVRVMANVNLLRDAYAASEIADGIGLYRSEFPFIIHQGFPSEETQYRIYRDIVSYFPRKSVTLRTADIGGDKLIGAEHEGDANPFLGVRGIRFSLSNRDLFRAQLRAMLRAGAGRNLRIMFPMVSTPDEVTQARDEVTATVDELLREGVPVNASPSLGAMIEIPSAVIAVDEMTQHLDFLSIGTNDLIMYMLAVDRTNSRVAGLYRTHHPVILRTLSYIVEHAGDAAKVSVCGAAAGDPSMIPFLLGIGIRELSVPPHKVETVRTLIGSLSEPTCEEAAAHMLSIRTWPQMERYLVDVKETDHGWR